MTGLAQAEVLVRCFEAQITSKSDCHTNLSPADCNPAKIDVKPDFWIYLPQDICAKIVGDEEIAKMSLGLAPKQ